MSTKTLPVFNEQATKALLLDSDNKNILKYIPDIAEFLTEPHQHPDDSEIQGRVDPVMLIGVLTKLDSWFSSQKIKIEEEINSHESMINEARSASETLQQLEKKYETNETTTIYNALSANIFSKAKIPPTEKVMYHIGSDVWAEYTIPEVCKVLTTRIENLSKSIETKNEELSTILSQITVNDLLRQRVSNFVIQLMNQQNKNNNE